MTTLRWTTLWLLQRIILLTILLIGCHHDHTATTALPLGFVEEGVTKYPAAISGTMVPNPRRRNNNNNNNNNNNSNAHMLILAKKEGLISVWEDPDRSDVSTLLLNLTAAVCTNGPRGIQTIVAHPDFITNPYLYVYYTRYTKDCPANAVTGPSNRLSRFTLNVATWTMSVASELVIFETPPSVNLLHDGGGMVIGSDRTLYLATGDGGMYDSSQNLRNTWGKLLRFHLDGRDGVPVDNPYYQNGGVPCRKNRGVPSPNAPATAKCEEIYSYGFRNPFRIDLDTRTSDDNNEVRFSISDVGGRVWEEVSYGGTNYKDKNYGWPNTEGPCTRDTLDDCPVPTTTGNNNNNMVDPYYYYLHNQSTGAAVTGAVHVPPQLSWPTEFQLLQVDFSEGIMYNLVPDAKQQCRTCQPPRPGYRKTIFHSYPKIVDLFFAAYQNTTALYFITRYGTESTVRRIYYTGSTNAIPTAVISGVKPLYRVGETISFGGNLSSDPDGDTLTYQWDFGDGRRSTLMSPKLKFNTRGSYTVTLTVTDTMKQSSIDTITVAVGDKPVAKMDSPKGGTLFKVGDILRLQGSAFDMALNRSITDPSQFVWEVRQHHETHFHPFLDLESGNDFAISPAPIPEDFYAASNSYLQVIMTVYDSDGISSTVSRYIYPKKVQITFKSEPSGLEILLDGVTFVTPVTVITWQNQRFTMDANDQGKHKFSSWSTGTAREATYLVPSTISNTTITAYFRQALRPTGTPVSPPNVAPTNTPAPSGDTTILPWFKQVWNKIKNMFRSIWNGIFF